MSEKQANNWHKRGIILSIVSFIVLITVGVFEISRLPASWHIVTQHSDKPNQVIKGIQGLDSEINNLESDIAFRINELKKAEVRAQRKSIECSMGKGESGETVDEKGKAELMKLAPQWEEVANKAAEALKKHSAN